MQILPDNCIPTICEPPDILTLRKESEYGEFVASCRTFTPRRTSQFYSINTAYCEKFLKLLRWVIERDALFALEVASSGAREGFDIFPAIVLAETVLYEEKLREKNLSARMISSAWRRSFANWQESVVDRANSAHIELSRARLRSSIKRAAEVILAKHPAVMADFMAYFVRVAGSSMKDVPGYVKKTCGRIFERYPAATLFEGGGRKRDVKITDLIKVLHVKGMEPGMSEAYFRVMNR